MILNLALILSIQMKKVDADAEKVLKFNFSYMDNYFKIFNLDISYKIDLKQLESQYHKLQSKNHPDKQNISEIEFSILLNNAYKNLNNDFLRACHILALNDIDILHDQTAVKVKQETLIEILEIQEQISEQDNIKIIQELQNKITENFNQNLEKSMSLYQDNKINESSQFLIKAKYLKKSLEDLKIKKSQIRNAT
ncbi:MAG: Fe-S protein assembly co-chaperone HscB [Rickettsiales bacterium]|nr:Fe-S protein assembly co-chaperone HscB [Rickettsiales bacterium]